MTFNAGGWPRFGANDGDWQFRDWSSFSALELDVRNPGETACDLIVELHDTCERVHSLGGKITYTLPPGEVTRVVLPLFPLPNEQIWTTSVYFDGHFRLGEVCSLVFTMRQIDEPVTLWFDNLRLVP